LIDINVPPARPEMLRGMLFARLLIFLAALLAMPALAGVDSVYPQAKGWFPEAERFGELEGEPRAAPVYADGEVAGYVFLTNDVVRIPAYSGKPINSLVGVDRAGRIRGVAIVHHEEPILDVGVSEARLRAFSGQYAGKSVFDRVVVGAEREGHVSVDTISGATITVMVQNETLMRAARRVAESGGLSSTSKITDQEPLWRGVWRERKFSIAVLAGGLAALIFILLFQDWLARKPRFLGIVRHAFLLYTVFFIGWYALAQLSIVHVLTFVHAAVRDFRWETFLIDPMLFILWSFVALTLLLWGRGVYCGWLCPFGALQELLQQLARRLGVRQMEFPDVVHERLWGLKYLVLIGLFGVSLQSMGEAARLSEIEPFKTAVTLRFEREWPFVLYAAALLAISVVNRKFFCKYLCPLGAALSIPGRFRVFDWWLRRRKECGRPCQTCSRDCEVRAIRPTGEINANECHYCLDCQVTYYSDRRCMPLIERRLKRERRAGAKLIHIKADGWSAQVDCRTPANRRSR
jgi:NosR/NirI family transcriptional regulator, nitrous oxide reductase regulator